MLTMDWAKLFTLQVFQLLLTCFYSPLPEVNGKILRSENIPHHQVLEFHLKAYLTTFALQNQELSQPNFEIHGDSISTNFLVKLITENSIRLAPVKLYSSHTYVNFSLGPDPEFRTTLPQNRFLGHYYFHLIQISRPILNSLLLYCSKLVLFGSPHRDRFIFFGDFSVLALLFESPVLRNLKYRVGIDVNDGLILREPAQAQDERAFHTTQFIPPLERKYINLRGRHLKVAAAPIPPYITFGPDGSINGGTHYLMLLHYGEKYNFSMELDTETVKGTGIFRNGLWNGMTGAVYYRVADMSIMMGGTVERYGVIDFICFQPDVVFFITRPPNVRVKWQAIVYPYTPSAWLLIITTYIAVSITIYVKLRVVHDRKTYFHTIFIPYQITLDQGFDIPIPDRVKILTALWMFFVIVISTGYRSDMVSYFSFPEPEVIPRDFETLDKRPDYKVVFNYHAGTAFQYFDSAKYGVMRRIRERFELQPNTAACGIAAALEPHTVCICWGLVIRPIISGNLSLPGAGKPMIVLSKPAVTFPIGFALPKNSIYTDTFELLTGYHRDMGLVQKWNHDVYENYSVVGKAWMKTQTHTEVFRSIELRWRESQTKVRSFKLSNLTAILVFLPISLSVAGLGFISEHIYYRASKVRMLGLLGMLLGKIHTQRRGAAIDTSTLAVFARLASVQSQSF